MTKQVVRAAYVWRPISGREAHRHGLKPKPPVAGQIAGVVDVRELWIESELNSHWTVAYRLAIDDEHALVSEVRIFPREQGRSTPGRWSAEWLGLKARAPAGGISTKLIRSVRLGHDVHALEPILKQARKQQPELFDLQHGWLGGLGLTPYTAGHDGRRASKKAGGRGRPSLSVDTYANIAGRYAAAVKKGSRRPVLDVAKQLRLAPATVRMRVSRARNLGLLESGTQGARGGKLTAKGRRAFRKKRTR